MKTAIVAAAISALATGSVLAADLSYRAPAAMPAAFDWNGLYFGGSIGGAWESVRSNDDSYNIFNNFGGLGLVLWWYTTNCICNTCSTEHDPIIRSGVVASFRESEFYQGLVK